MSKKSDFISDVLRAGRVAGGSKKTQHDRHNKLVAFSNWLWRSGYQLVSAESIRVQHIAKYIEARIGDDLNLRTLQNDMASIRACLRGAGRIVFSNSPEIANQALGISGASRHGTKRPITGVEFQDVHQRACSFDAGLAAIFSLQRWLGLRAREAIMAVQSLADWVAILATGASKIKVIHGTKGGRARDTTLHHLKEASAAIQLAHEIATQRNGILITAPNLAAALGYYHRNSRALGLEGEIAPHSLRYSYACDAVDAYKRLGHNEREAHALAAIDLGHGSGRGRLIREIYGRRPKPE